MRHAGCSLAGLVRDDEPFGVPIDKADRRIGQWQLGKAAAAASKLPAGQFFEGLLNWDMLVIGTTQAEWPPVQQGS